MSTPNDFSGQVAVVTGAGRGLGRSYALELARRGAHVVVNDWAGAGGPSAPDEEGLRADRVVAEIGALGGSAEASYDDISDPEGSRALIAGAEQRTGAVDVIVSNAGILRNGLYEDLSATDVDDVLAVHLRGAINVTQPAWAGMRQRGYGRIVLVSSSSGLFAHQGLANYAAAKAGLLGLGRALAFEGRHDDIRVNCVLPMAKTQMTIEAPIPEHPEEFAARCPAGSGDLMADRGTPEVATPLVTLLASRACPGTGEAYSSCMGRYARVFVGVADGWLAPDVTAVSAETLIEHLDEIRGIAPFSEPDSLYGEIAGVAERLLDPSASR